MSSLRRGLLGAVLSFAVVGGCADTGENSENAPPTGRQTGTAKDAAVIDSDDLLPDDCKTGDAGGGATDAGKADGGSAVVRDAGTAAKPDAGGTTGPKPNLIMGTAVKNKCSSVGKPTGNMCGSYYCGVNESQIAAELASDSLCGNVKAVCEGRLVSVVATCARSTLIANLGMSFEAIRPKVQECVYKDAEFKQLVPATCLGCFLDAAVCAGNKCLAECLGDGPNCDACRQKNNCDQTVFTCAKLPNPF